MWERELVISSFVGELTAIPHGTHASREFVNFAQLTIHRYLEPIDWDGESVMLTVGIASANDDHVELLGTLAEVLMEPSQREVLFTSQEPAEIVELIGKAFTNP
jgi:mannitol/fructose-specific phosphotransferase system IIA component